MLALARHRCLSALLLALVVLGVGAHRARAHGDEMHAVLEDAPLGPYTLSVWMAPPTLRPGEVHVAAAVSDQGAPVPDCQVALLVTALGREETPIRVQAGPATPATAYRHEASLTIPHDGRYRFTITVRDPVGSGGQQQFDAVVRPVSLWMNLLIFAQIVLAPFVGVWLLSEGVVVWRRRLKGYAQERMR